MTFTDLGEESNLACLVPL